MFFNNLWCFGGSVKPHVLDRVAPAMRSVQGSSLCIHARVDDENSGFFLTNEEAIANENIAIEDGLVERWSSMFNCAEVRVDVNVV